MCDIVYATRRVHGAEGSEMNSCGEKNMQIDILARELEAKFLDCAFVTGAQQ